MNKNLLIKFINKYSLGDSIKHVNWKIIPENKELKTRGELDSKTFIMDVTLKNFTDMTEPCRIPVVNTDKVKSMLGPFDDEITLSINKFSDRIIGFTLSNEDCESYCAAADPSVIPPVTKDLTDKHVYDIELNLTREFVDKILKAVSAMDDIPEITIKKGKKDKIEFVIGYSTSNSNRISIAAPENNVVNSNLDIGKALKFPLANIVQVLKVNKEIENAKCYIKTLGVFKLTYSDDNFECNYWQFANIKN